MADAPAEAVLYEDWLIKYMQSQDDPIEALLARSAGLGLVGNNGDFYEETLRIVDRDAARLPAIRAPTASPSAAMDVDSFFEEFPECCKSPDEAGDVSLDERDRDKKVFKPVSVRTSSTQTDDSNMLQQRQKPSASQPAFSSATIHHSVAPPPARSTENPYSKMQPLAVAHPSPAASSWNQPPPQQSISWDQMQNPFQTAREYAGANKSQQRPAAVQNTSNPYRRPDESSSSPPPPPQPIIRDSLKRKFQPPSKRTANPLSNATATTDKGSGSTKPKSDQDEEDDLPEELRKFGKELVMTIENEIMENTETITFAQIAGLGFQKQIVQEVVCWPLKRPDLFTGLRRAPNGLLLYGPPGTGKTLIGKAIANEAEATFFSISSSSITSKWMGQGEKLVRTLFGVAAYRQPAVVFIDEIDSLLTQRKSDEAEASRRIKTEFLIQLDGVSSGNRVLVIGATNRPQELDEAARRRFTKRLYIPLPELDDRESLLRVLLESNQHELQDAEIRKLAQETAGYSGADLKCLCTDAALGPIRKFRNLEDVDISSIPPISYKHFRRALKSMKPSVAESDLRHYIEWDALYGSKHVNDDDSDSD